MARRTDLPTEGARQDMFAITLHVEGHPNLQGYWDKKTGGEIDSDEVKYYPGASYKPVSLGGRIVPGNITLQRLFDRDDDYPFLQGLIDSVGKARASVTQRPLDLNGNLFGDTRVEWTGIVKRVLIPDVDSESTSAALIEIEISIDETADVKSTVTKIAYSTTST